MKKIVAIMMTALMLVLSLSVFASCDSTEQGGASTTPSAGASTTPSAGASTTPKDAPKVTIGYTIYEPMNYFDDKGKLTGFDTELARKVFEDAGYVVEFKEIDWASKYTDLASGNIDCIWNGFTANVSDDDGVARASKVDFSYNYMENQQAIVVKSGSGIASAADFNGKICRAEAGSAGEEYAKGFEGVMVQTVSKQTDALLEVKSGTADLAVLDMQLAKSYCGKGDYADLEIIETLSSDVEYYAVGFKKGSDLTAVCNERLEALAKDGTILALAKEFGVENSVITDFASQKK